jgi:hypothetical protein
MAVAPAAVVRTFLPLSIHLGSPAQLVSQPWYANEKACFNISEGGLYNDLTRLACLEFAKAVS